jgi:uncharacterized protein (TIGR03437 family)
LPAGLFLDPNSGTLSGIPTAAGSSSFTVAAKDVRGATIATNSYNLTVLPGLMITNKSPLQPGVANQDYRPITLQGSGGALPYTFGIQSAFGQNQNLPPGLNITPSGKISGTPFTAGTYTFNLAITDCANRDSDGFCAGYTAVFPYVIIVVNQLVFTTSTPLPAGATNNFYMQTIAVSGGQSPYMFVIKDLPNAPPGLTLDANSGVLGGTPTMTGTFSFNVQVNDSLNFAVTKVFALTISAGVSLLQVLPSRLDFDASVGGDRPDPQSLRVTSTTPNAVGFSVQVDGGQQNAPSPFLLTVNPLSGTTPAGLLVSVAQVDQNSSPLAPGKYMSRIVVSAVAIPVTLTVSIVPAKLTAAPAAINFTARRAKPGSFTQAIVLRNAGGGGPVNFNATVDTPASWIFVNPAGGSTNPDHPGTIQVQFNTQQLDVGGYPNSITIKFTQGATKGSITVPVLLFIADAGPIIGVDGVGQRFEAQQGMGTSETIPVTILNNGDPATLVNFTAKVQPISGGAWLNVNPASSSAGASKPAIVTLSLNAVANSLAPGGYYALLEITDPQSQDSPQYIVIVLDIAPTTQAPRPAPVPEGYVFTGQAGGASPPTLNEIVHTSSSAPIKFQASATTNDGSPWLSVDPASGDTSTASPGQLTITANPASLKQGVYTGNVNIAIGGALRSVNITFIVIAPASSTEMLRAAAAAAGGCVASRLVLTQTGLTNNFAIPAGWPETISVNLNDDCGNPINNGSVVATFSNGDPALSLPSLNSGGVYSSTWQPRTVTGETSVNVQATSGALTMATTKISGGVAPSIAPILAKGGTVNAFTHASGPLAPGTVTEMYGAGLAAGTIIAKLPLPKNIQGTTVLFGNQQPALFFVSAGQLDIEIPPELTPGRQYNVIVNANGALTLPDVITLNTVQPDVGYFVDGGLTRALVQHSNGKLVKSTNPAKPDEVLVLYVLGMGTTNPPVGSGQQTPGASKVTIQPTLTVAGEQAKIDYAGLTPFAIGLYQINFHVPKDAKSGDLDLVVTQNNVVSNTTKLRVSQ